MKDKILKNNKGFTAVDATISIIIIVAFISIITTSFYNYYISIQSKNRQTVATNIMIDIIENVEMMTYEEITTDTVNTIIDNLRKDGTIQTPYEVTATIEKYNEREGNQQKKDLIKILKVSVSYISDNKEEKTEISRLITK